jgi:tetratricopeptide (TPR) repeat protein
MRERIEPANQYAWIVYAIAMVMFGGLAGYIIAMQNSQHATATAVGSTSAAAAPATPIVDESELRGYRDILARDPKNLQAAVKAGNLLYDGQRYVEAIPFYQQAFALSPSDVNISTDLGTALWYAGRADEALAQYDRSLALNATHAQTLFNAGIVRADGKRDYAGAVAAWEKLLKTNPDYPGAPRVRELLTDARQKLTR